MSRLNLIDMFKSESAETFNKCSKAYELGRTDEREKTIDECKAILSEAMAIDAKAKCHIYMVALTKMEQLKSHK